MNVNMSGVCVRVMERLMRLVLAILVLQKCLPLLLFTYFFDCTTDNLLSPFSDIYYLICFYAL